MIVPSPFGTCQHDIYSCDDGVGRRKHPIHLSDYHLRNGRRRTNIYMANEVRQEVGKRSSADGDDSAISNDNDRNDDSITHYPSSSSQVADQYELIAKLSKSTLHYEQERMNPYPSSNLDSDIPTLSKLNVSSVIPGSIANGYKASNGKKPTARLPFEINNNRHSRKAKASNRISTSNKKQLTSSIRSLWKKRNAKSIEEGIRRERTSPFGTAIEIPRKEPPEKKKSILADKKRRSEVINRVAQGVGDFGKSIMTRYLNTFDAGNSKQTMDDHRKNENLEAILDETSSFINDPDYDVNSQQHQQQRRQRKQYAARTIAGLISALAEEATGLDVQVDSRDDTPLWGKHVNTVKVQFSRLGFAPLRMGGLEQVLYDVEELTNATDSTAMRNERWKKIKESRIGRWGKGAINGDAGLASDNLDLDMIDFPNSADETFDQIDVDKSGALDEEELQRALAIASELGGATSDEDKSMAMLSRMASRLISLYDTNGDGVVDREEYRQMVNDMTALRDTQRLKIRQREEKERERRLSLPNPIKGIKLNLTQRSQQSQTKEARDEGGSIVLSDLKLDLRRLVFGGVPLVKKITPGGPLILEPFTMTLSASFNREDMMESELLDDGLRRLVARALRRRVRSVRDLFDGAVFYGRSWNMASTQAPVVEVPKLTNIEFDNRDRLIITGRAKIRASPDQPFIEQSFKLRTKLGTRENGQYIRLDAPELAIVVECPKAWERNTVSVCKKFFNYTPTRPKPLYTYVPLVSPLKKTDQDGFNLGEDNRIKSIYIKDGALRFEISAVLRPGRFLGNHYLAFTVPNRTFIITMERVREGIRTARKNKREMARASRRQKSDRYNDAVAKAVSSSDISGVNEQIDDFSYQLRSLDEEFSFLNPEDENGKLDDNIVMGKTRPGFFGKFLEGYIQAAREEEEAENERNEMLTTAISEFFGTDEQSDIST